MLRYIVDMEDEVRVADGMIGIFSGARMMMFPLEAVRRLETVRNVPVDKTVQDTLRFEAADALLGRDYEIFLPERHAAFAEFSAALAAALPGFDAQREGVFTPPACDGNGHHRN